MPRYLCAFALLLSLAACPDSTIGPIPCKSDQNCPAGWACKPSGACEKSASPAISCDDAKKNGSESDVDCGGSCAACADGKACAGAKDCTSGRCAGGICAAVSCSDAERDGSESDVDCGGSCTTKCADGKGCGADADCAAGRCANRLCAAPSCTDGVRDGSESDVDCGAGCPTRCGDGKGCATSADCSSKACAGGGLCAAPSCTDGVKNGTESDADCGAGCPTRCADGKSCGASADCSSGSCGAGSLCAAASCNDGTQNGGESDVDCGGTCTARCAIGQRCTSGTDCATGLCTSGKCANGCADGAKDGDETDVDCGGACGATCALGKSCKASADCASAYCHTDKTCRSSLLSGLVAYWPLEEASGVRKDVSGGGADLTPSSTGVTQAVGKSGKGVEIGKDPNDLGNRLTTPSAPQLHFDGDFTFAVWTNLTATFYSAEHVMKKNDELVIHHERYMKPDRIVASYGRDASPLAVVESTPTTQPATGWVFIVVYRKGSTLHLRINDSAETTAAIAAGTVTNTRDLTIGRDPDLGYPWQGFLDEIGKWSRALTAAEITDLYNAGAGKTYPFSGPVCGEAACVAVSGAKNGNHFTGAGCTGTESYYTPYDSGTGMPNPNGLRYSWDGAGVAGTVYRTQTNRSFKDTAGVCSDLWPSGNTLDNFVTIYR